MNNTEMKVDLYELAIDAGMTDEEFTVEVGRLYASNLSVILEENPGQMVVYTVNYLDHDLEIIGRRIPAENVSIN